MQAAPTPENEAARLGHAAIARSSRPSLRGDLRGLCRPGGPPAKAPAALISLIDESRQWFAGRHGGRPDPDRAVHLLVRPRHHRPHEVMWVEDAPARSAVQRQSPGRRRRHAFLRRAPLNVNGFAVGALCVLAPESRPFDPGARRDACAAWRPCSPNGLKSATATTRFNGRWRSRSTPSSNADEAGVITDWRLGSEALFGYSAEEAVGQSMAIILPSALRQAHLDRMTQWRETACPACLRTVELAAVRKDGGAVDVELRCRCGAATAGR